MARFVVGSIRSAFVHFVMMMMMIVFFFMMVFVFDDVDFRHVNFFKMVNVFHVIRHVNFYFSGNKIHIINLIYPSGTGGFFFILLFD